MSENNKDNIKEIFLITNVLESQNNIGSIFIRDIVSASPNLKVHWHVEGLSMMGHWMSRAGVLGRVMAGIIFRMGFINNIRIMIFKKYLLKLRVDQIEKKIKEAGAGKIWITTSSPEIICIAHELSRRSNDVRLTVWDAPEYIIQNFNLSQKLENYLMKCFNDLLGNVKVCSVISEGMKNEYVARVSNGSVVIMRHGVESVVQLDEKRNKQKNIIKIIFAGSLYSKNEWNSFVEALNSVNWMVANRSIELEFIGDFPLKGATYPAQMVLHPSVENKYALEIMAKADIGYLPYWLDKKREHVAITSFPGKMTAYSAAGLAIFHHGPTKSSVTEFLTKYPYGVACDSLNASLIIKKLEDLILILNEPNIRDARELAMHKELSDVAMMVGFNTLIKD